MCDVKEISLVIGKLELVMKTLYVVLFKACVNGHDYTSLSNFYFKTDGEARSYARHFVELSDTFSTFEIYDVMPYIV